MHSFPISTGCKTSVCQYSKAQCHLATRASLRKGFSKVNVNSAPRLFELSETSPSYEISHVREKQWSVESSSLLPEDIPKRTVHIQSIDEETDRKISSVDDLLCIQMVQWYPGHIARAERQLKEQLKMVDVVLEIRDARIPISTHHPQVSEWIGGKTRVLILNRLDMITKDDQHAWSQYFKKNGQKVYWTDGRTGTGILKVLQILQEAGDVLTSKRGRRGLKPRAVRACVIGFPNIGKSALINRLLGRKAVASAPKPGITRVLRWVRLIGELDLLDAPGVIPVSFNNQIAAQRLAMCNDIGEAAYEDYLIAAAFIARCRRLPSAPKLLESLSTRYGVDASQGSAEDVVCRVADATFLGDRDKAGARVLKDFRAGALGAFALELPEDMPDKK